MLLVVTLGLNLARATGPATTMINDVVFRANGTPASGTLLLSWPAFTTRDGMAVAAGSMSLDIGASGTVTVLLAPNEGATPTGTYYKVVFKLDELKANMRWLIGNGSPGVIKELADRVSAHDAFLQRARGVGAVVVMLLTLIHFGIDYLKLRH